jgi:hypothetical protein
VVSLALLRWFIARTPGIDVVDPTSLPDRLHALYLDTVQIASAPVHLIERDDRHRGSCISCRKRMDTSE